MFGTVLVANRGEIALRVIRTCRELGIRVAAVYSTEDRDSPVVRAADTAVQIGPAPSRQSYLNIPAIIAAAQQVGADAIHPGYGFLSEDADFAEVCETAGIAFIGPPSPVMHRLADKVVARAVMSEAGLPLLPGSVETIEDAETARRLADEIGYPVIIKAAAGGGGRGMQVARDRAGFATAYHEARGRAQAFFNDSRVYVERFLPTTRHIEVQVLCDGQDNALHLGERDCSVQRRRQKLIEETPAPNLDRDLAARMARAAVRGARAAGYVGAGTFEFLVDDRGDFYFMEVNCRIQVEHPVTEMVTGIDIVAEQIRIAAGLGPSVGQVDVDPRGVALECRINAEDAARGFAPTPGVLTTFTPPAGPFVRVDTHAVAGYRVPAAYDSLLAKLIVWAPDRDRALARMRRALDEFAIGPGEVRTTTSFLRRVLDEPAFRAGRHVTSLVEDMHPDPADARTSGRCVPT
jgi:acetyl-CoA carboxylase biotin carboxylase subunit